MLHRKYYTDYGLAIEGLVRHHKVDALEYNRKVDDALPLDGVITEDSHLRRLLEDIDKTKVRLWLFTNAHVTHGKRIVRLLGIEDLFEGITYCDYSKEVLICKPHREMFNKAEAEAGISSTQHCFFIGGPYHRCYKAIARLTRYADDNYGNCREAEARGWTTAHLIEPEDPLPHTPASKYQIRSLEELRCIWPQLFKASAPGAFGQSQL